MKRLIMTLVTLILVHTTNSWAGNSVYIKQDNQNKLGSVYIKQDGGGNTFGISTSAPFVIDGPNLTISVKNII